MNSGKSSIGFNLTIVLPVYLGPFENPFGEIRSHGADKAKRCIESIATEPVNVICIADGCEKTLSDLLEITHHMDSVHVDILTDSPNRPDADGVRRKVDYGNAALDYALDSIDSGWVGYASTDDWIEKDFYQSVSYELTNIESMWAWTNTGRSEPPSWVDDTGCHITGIDIYHRAESRVRWTGCGQTGQGGYGHDHGFAAKLQADYGTPSRINVPNGYIVGHVPTRFDR